MKCLNPECGHSDDPEHGEYYGPAPDPFIEIRGFERGPFFAGLEKRYDLIPGNQLPMGLSAIERGKEISAYACPCCGSIQFKTGDLK